MLDSLLGMIATEATEMNQETYDNEQFLAAGRRIAELEEANAALTAEVEALNLALAVDDAAKEDCKEAVKVLEWIRKELICATEQQINEYVPDFDTRTLKDAWSGLYNVITEVRLQRDGLRTEVARLTAEAERLQANETLYHSMYDALQASNDPEMDGTDGAHPAYWRGHDYTTKMFCALVIDILDGKDNGAGANTEPWATVRKRLLSLTAQPCPYVKQSSEGSAFCSLAEDGLARTGEQVREACAMLMDKLGAK